MRVGDRGWESVAAAGIIELMPYLDFFLSCRLMRSSPSWTCVQSLALYISGYARVLVCRSCHGSRSVAHILRFRSQMREVREGLYTWLHTAGMLPLHISVFSRNENTYQEDVPQVARILEVLVPLCRQWKYLNLQVPASSLRVFGELRGVDVPLLESATIAHSDSYSLFGLEKNSCHPSFLLETAPSLSHIKLGDAGPLFRLVIPWNQSRFLSLDYNDRHHSA
ncbi:hypothetical protein F5050DRAFT_1024319 [Lentinula boryana]|uniref:Uncharacterized protein n=1 Tax=Lentinula boryana TaxID=40481 RepID=A0ABQ8QLC6_9AGAR|nr:hypothetical protein F5050DRAFT_1024319 [Lentinula boryana]